VGEPPDPTPDAGGDGSTPAAGDPSPEVGGSRRLGPSRRRIVAALVVVAAMATAALVFAEARRTPISDGASPSRSRPAKTVAFDLPEAEVPRLLVDGAVVVRLEPDSGIPVSEFSHGSEVQLQIFRPEGRFMPTLYLTTFPLPGGSGSIDMSFGEPITVRGRGGYVGRSERDTANLYVDLDDGSALDVMAVGLTDDQIIRFLDGLTRDGLNDPWTSTVDVRGLREVTAEPPPADGRSYEVVLRLPAGVGGAPDDPYRSLGLNLYSDGFESRLRGLLPGSVRPVETVEIDGVPAVLGTYDEDKDYWVLMEPEPGRALAMRTGYDRATVDWILAHAHFVDEATWDAATANPEYPS
jgi:hypothetical protein